MSDVANEELDGETSAEEISDRQAVQAAMALARRKLPTVEPEPDEMGDMPPQFVSNGWVRMTIDGQSCKMRRPYLGELERLEALLDTHRHELTEMHDRMQAEIADDVVRAKEIEHEARSLNGNQADRKRELDDEATKLGMKAMERSDTISRHAARLRAEWWTLAFDMLTPAPFTKPKDMPAWVKDAVLQNNVLQHWQSVPLALGSE